MKFLPDDLKKEYDYFIKTYPDIKGMEHPYINLSDSFRAYFILAHYFTDTSTSEERESMLVGIRSIDLLASALSRQIVSYDGKNKYSEPLEICATLFFGVVKNHSFNDGNKRTALLLLLYQLQLFRYYPNVSQKKFETLVVSVAEGSLETRYPKIYKSAKKTDDPAVATITALLKQWTTKKNNSYDIEPTMKEFCSALENVGVKCIPENCKMKFTYTPKDKWYRFSSNERNYAIPFRGWSRTVGPRAARTTLEELGLYEQYPTYRTILNGQEPLYELVDKYKEPLRRLKDK